MSTMPVRQGPQRAPPPPQTRSRVVDKHPERDGVAHALADPVYWEQPVLTVSAHKASATGSRTRHHPGQGIPGSWGGGQSRTMGGSRGPRPQHEAPPDAGKGRGLARAPSRDVAPRVFQAPGPSGTRLRVSATGFLGTKRREGPPGGWGVAAAEGAQGTGRGARGTQLCAPSHDLCG